MPKNNRESSLNSITVRSSHLKCFIKEGILKNFVKFAGNACNFIKKIESGTGIFLKILLKFYEHLFYRTPPGECFYTLLFQDKIGNCDENSRWWHRRFTREKLCQLHCNIIRLEKSRLKKIYFIEMIVFIEHPKTITNC